MKTSMVALRRFPTERYGIPSVHAIGKDVPDVEEGATGSKGSSCGEERIYVLIGMRTGPDASETKVDPYIF
jgi:hypothetical protein